VEEDEDGEGFPGEEEEHSTDSGDDEKEDENGDDGHPVPAGANLLHWARARRTLVLYE
jgi:hypothetical protein